MASAVRLIRSDVLSDAAQYAYASTVPAGTRLVFLAGACPLEPDGSTAAVGDYAGQAALCIETMREALRAAGASIEDVSTRVLVASSRQADLVAAWQVVRDAFGAHDVPSTLLGVTVLGYDDQLVEIEAVAAVADGQPA
ncbi:RidA family protein [Curtobacterium sp. WHRI 8282]|uniref:RidA family protein n=1 Tax=Curtobacterium sp. WHRI 8282 TaxID=3162559 RepID=UPI0032F05189